MIKRVSVFLLITLFLSACYELRQSRARKHQPFSPHHEGPMKPGKNHRR